MGRRRPMSAATKAKIAAAMKGNKNAYKTGGSKKPGRGELGGKRSKKTGVKQIRNKGYGKRRAALNLAGTAAVGLLGYNAALGVKNKHFTRKGKKGTNTRASVAIGGGAAAGLAAAVARSHKIGMAKRKAKKNGTVLIVGRGKKTNAYVPVQTKRDKRKAAKKARVPQQPRPASRKRKKAA